ncbi:MAG: AAA family ATPase, partial [Gammaproteobacteria bacterium]
MPVVLPEKKTMHKENKTPLKTRIELLIKKLSEGLHERKEHAAVALLAVLAGQNIFLLGPPGTAKSMLARRLKSAFADSNYFEYLMQRFSTPDEIFG